MMTLDQSDFDCIGQIAKHCDNAKLCIAIEEARIFDIEPLLCDMYPDVDTNWDSEDEPWVNLIDGGKYTGCNDKERRHLGVKRVWIYYSYARYLMLNSFNDSPNGTVTKTNQWSIPKPLQEVESFSDKYRSMGYKSWAGVEAYLCANKDLTAFEDFNDKNCKGCGCKSGDCGGTSTKGYGLIGKEVTKYDV